MRYDTIALAVDGPTLGSSSNCDAVAVLMFTIPVAVCAASGELTVVDVCGARVVDGEPDEAGRLRVAETVVRGDRSPRSGI